MRLKSFANLILIVAVIVVGVAGISALYMSLNTGVHPNALQKAKSYCGELQLIYECQSGFYGIAKEADAPNWFFDRNGNFISTSCSGYGQRSADCDAIRSSIGSCASADICK